MKKTIITYAFICFGWGLMYTAYPQDKPDPGSLKPVAEALKDIAPPQLSPESKVAILKLQLRQKQMEVQYREYQNQLTALQKEFEQSQKQFNDAVDAAYKEANADKEKWALDLDKLEFNKKPEPPKKEEKK